jgi:FKBP-type peptidyl-prolyl cis-trans isomerase 2
MVLILVPGLGSPKQAGLSEVGVRKETVMIAVGNRVSLEYTLTLDDGTIVTTNVGSDPYVYVHGDGHIPSALERKLEGLLVEDRREIILSPEEAYGPIDPEEFKAIDIQSVPEHARKNGTFIEVAEPGASTRVARVHEVFEDRIVLDFNHKLAGERLTFQVRIVRIEPSPGKGPQ